MDTVKMTKWRCEVCGHISTDDELLTTTSPFRADDILTACPKCRMTEGFTEICAQKDTHRPVEPEEVYSPHTILEGV